MKSVVLVVDDDPLCLDLSRQLIERAHYTFIGARSLGEARRLAERTPPDIALVDLMVGSENGLDLVRLWRVEQRFPILIVSARGEPIDRVIGLEVGADDYLTKPYEPRELQLRIRNALEHSEKAARMPRSPSSWLTTGRLRSLPPSSS